MSNKKDNIMKGIQVVLWIAWAVSFLCMITLEGKWQSKVFSLVMLALSDTYIYKKNPTGKTIKNILIAFGSVFTVFVILTLINL